MGAVSPAIGRVLLGEMRQGGGLSLYEYGLTSLASFLLSS